VTNFILNKQPVHLVSRRNKARNRYFNGYTRRPISGFDDDSYDLQPVSEPSKSGFPVDDGVGSGYSIPRPAVESNGKDVAPGTDEMSGPPVTTKVPLNKSTIFSHSFTLCRPFHNIKCILSTLFIIYFQTHRLHLL